MTVKTTKLGPGTLTVTIAAVGAPIDFSCQVSKAVVTPGKDKDDDVVMLCGDTKAGATTYTATLDVTIDQDLEDPAGFVYATWTHRGEVAAVTFTPNTAAGGTVTGNTVVDPVSVGGDTGGDDMTSDFSWDFVGFPTLTPGAGAGALSA